MKFMLRLLLVLSLAISPVLAKKKPPQTCDVNFAFVYIDRLDNTYRGIQGKDLKQVQDKLSNYGDVCYTPDEAKADYIFLAHTKPVKHLVYTVSIYTWSKTATHTDSNNVSGTITDENGNVPTVNGAVDTTRTTTTTSTPYEVDYGVFIFDILLGLGSTVRTFIRLPTFNKELHKKIYNGKSKHRIVTVIDAAAKWLHENNLGRPSVDFQLLMQLPPR